jgi:hypothetical protein
VILFKFELFFSSSFLFLFKKLSLCIHKHTFCEQIPLQAKYSEMNFGNAYASVGAALPEVARKSCPVSMRQLGYCNDTTASMGTELGTAMTSPARLALSGSKDPPTFLDSLSLSIRPY